MYIDFDNESVNYYEITLLNSYNPNIKYYDVNLSKEKFKQIMQKAAIKNLKFFQKQYTEEVWNNVHFQNDKNEDLKIIKKECITSKVVDTQFVVIGFNKVKMSLLNMPSTTDIFSFNITTRLTLRLSNRVYINFETKRIDDQDYFKVYINYNHDKNVDTVTTHKQIQQAISLLT